MEVYGVKPKIFTKEWWPYYWDYYKFHTIAVIFVLIIIISTVNECKNQTNYDLTLDVITENYISQDTMDALLNTVCENVEDVTGNEKVEAYINYIDMNENGDPQYLQAMHTKMTFEASYTDAFVFLMSKKYADYMSENEIFEPTSKWTDKESYNGYVIDLTNCQTLQNIGIDTSDLYLGIISIRESDKKSKTEENLYKQKNGIKFAKFLLNEE
ncbi:MAG: hypothetical protein IK057_01905 [Clostridia bacterium]|nr:hypothetical protein [Clostridia bacterium]